MKNEELIAKNQKLVAWAWENLEFNDCPDDPADSYIIDILRGYNGDCHTKTGKTMTYAQIRFMFENEREDDDNE